MPRILRPTGAAPFAMVLQILAAAGMIAGGCANGTAVPGDNGGASVGANDRCAVTIRLAEDVAAIHGQVLVDYSQTGPEAGFGPPGVMTRCRSLVASALPVFGNPCQKDCTGDDPYRYLELSFLMKSNTAESALQGPVDLFRCEFSGDGSTLDNLVLAYGDVMAPGGETHEVKYEIRHRCGADATTTTTSTTTTTTAPCDGDSCDAQPLALEMWLDDPVILDSVDLVARFPCSAGEFIGSGAGVPVPRPGLTGPVRCVTLSPDIELWETNQERSGEDGAPGCTRIFRLGALSMTGLHGPTPLVACEFLPGSGGVRAEDFDVSTYDWTASDMSPEVPQDVSLSIRGFP